MAGKRKPYVKLQCKECKNIYYITFKSKKAAEKLAMKKHCKFCRKHTDHKEIKR